MKKLNKLVLALLVMALFFSCEQPTSEGNDDGGNNNTTDPNTTTPVETETEAGTLSLQVGASAENTFTLTGDSTSITVATANDTITVSVTDKVATFTTALGDVVADDDILQVVDGDELTITIGDYETTATFNTAKYVVVSTTKTADDSDVEIAREAASIYASNPAYGTGADGATVDLGDAVVYPIYSTSTTSQRIHVQTADAVDLTAYVNGYQVVTFTLSDRNSGDDLAANFGFTDAELTNTEEETTNAANVNFRTSLSENNWGEGCTTLALMGLHEYIEGDRNTAGAEITIRVPVNKYMTLSTEDAEYINDGRTGLALANSGDPLASINTFLMLEIYQKSADTLVDFDITDMYFEK